MVTFEWLLVIYTVTLQWSAEPFCSECMKSTCECIIVAVWYCIYEKELLTHCACISEDVWVYLAVFLLLVSALLDEMAPAVGDRNVRAAADLFTMQSRSAQDITNRCSLLLFEHSVLYTNVNIWCHFEMYSSLFIQWQFKVITFFKFQQAL